MIPIEEQTDSGVVADEQNRNAVLVVPEGGSGPDHSVLVVAPVQDGSRMGRGGDTANQ